MKKLTVCYFGNYKSDFSRNRIYISGLRQNDVEVIECQDASKGLGKYVKLWRKHRAVKNDYDIMVVGYPGHIVVPFARVISKKPVVFDALCTLYEAETLSHDAGFIKGIQMKIIDWLAVRCAHVVLVETEPQRQFFIQKFGNMQKIKVLHVGVDDALFGDEKYQKVQKKNTYTVLFRGRITPEAGVDHIVDAAHILRDDPSIQFRIIGFGIREQQIKSKIEKLQLSNIELIDRELPWDELITKMAECHVSLGQFEKNDRLERTIPHKAFESFILKLPYITAQAGGIASVAKDHEECLFVPAADPQALVDAIVRLKNDRSLSERLTHNAYALYEKEFSSRKLGQKMQQILGDTLSS